VPEGDKNIIAQVVVAGIPSAYVEVHIEDGVTVTIPKTPESRPRKLTVKAKTK